LASLLFLNLLPVADAEGDGRNTSPTGMQQFLPVKTTSPELTGFYNAMKIKRKLCLKTFGNFFTTRSDF